ncbi:ATP-dependent zinc metalloprotease FtsH OS=Ureibacillus acetophenoni OX=614649 GN=ftsH PE=3 SV=1 [Ureibacillus acetophenoni]
MLDKIAGLLGGRVAEGMTFGEVSTGVHNDFQRATSIARSMVTEYGMSDKLGPMQFGSSQGGNVFLGRDFNSEQNYSDSIAYEIDKEMQSIIVEQYERTKQILTEKRDLLTLIAETLLEVETLDAQQIEHLRDHGKLPDRVDDSKVDNVETDKTEPANPTSDSVESTEPAIEKTGSTTLESDIGSRPSDPTTSDLPKLGPSSPSGTKIKAFKKIQINNTKADCLRNVDDQPFMM